ncbi:MAG TPA: alpha-amylase family glycosyl hydrolase [Spirochaetota bacterium]|mgnify:CR=1 FL=1|nr:alpha-amylase family glycosyl hydrolase [Spirochaetota bacterium]
MRIVNCARILITVSLIIITSCYQDQISFSADEVVLNIDILVNRSWTIFEYDVTARGGDVVKNVTSSSSTVTMVLTPGMWNIEVSAKNSSANILYKGKASVNLTSQTQSVIIPLLEESGSCAVTVNNQSGYSIAAGAPGHIEKISVTAKKSGFSDISKEIANYGDFAVFQNLLSGDWEFILEGKAKTIDKNYSVVAGEYTTYIRSNYIKTIVSGKMENFITSFLSDAQVKVTPAIPSAYSGTISSGTLITLSCRTSGSTIKYKINDGAILDYNAPFSITGANGSVVNVKVYAEKAGLENSIINELIYTIQNQVTPDPQFNPVGGTYQAAVGVTLSCSDTTATIYYATDGSTPDNTKPEYKYVSPFNISSDVTVKAIALAPGKTASSVITQTYTIVPAKVATPVISPQTGSYDADQDFSIICGTQGSTIYYTTDGSTPDNTKTQYVSPFKLAVGSKTVKAIAVKSGMTDSDISSASYTITDSFDGIAICFEKPDGWTNAFIWYDKDSNGSWETTTLGAAPGDMINYRTGWYKKELASTASVTFLFNDGTWNKTVKDNGADFITTKNIWVKKDGSKVYEDPLAPQPPQLSAAPGTSYFSTDTINVTLNVTGTNISTSKYTTDGSYPKTSPTAVVFSNGTVVTIGGDIAVGGSKTIRLYSINDVGESDASFDYIKTDAPEPVSDANNLRIYQIMVESFIDGDSNCNYNTGYGPSHHRGDIRGIINSLDYIKGLGMNAIWLTPIFDSDGSSALDATGYFCRDYFTIDPKFGSFNDAKELVEKAHQREMMVILDGVFGHHKGWVRPSPTGKLPSGGSNPVSYPGSLDFYKEVATYWIDALDIDGWRLDQAYQVATKNQDRNHWKDIREAVEAKCAERAAAGKQWGTLGYMVGEIWDSETNIQLWGYNAEGNAGLKSCFDFPLRYVLAQVLATQEEINQPGAYNQPATKLVSGYATHSAYSAWARPNLMLTNHDLVRFGDLIQRAPHLKYGKERPDYWKRHKAAFSFMTSYTGPITIYYGDEIGDEVANFVNKGDSGYYDDHVSRSSGQTSGFDANQSDLKNYLTSLMNLRESNPALWRGTRSHISADTYTYVDLKTDGAQKMLYVLNVSTDSKTVTVSQSAVGGTTLRGALGAANVNASGGGYSISIEGLTGKFYFVE